MEERENTKYMKEELRM